MVFDEEGGSSRLDEDESSLGDGEGEEKEERRKRRREGRAGADGGEGRLIEREKIDTGMPVDNIMIAADGALYAAGKYLPPIHLYPLPPIPNFFYITGYPLYAPVLKYVSSPSDPSTSGILAPSTALRITKNGGQDQFFGKKYAVDVVFADDGRLVVSATSVVVDSERGRMFLHGEWFRLWGLV